MTPAGLELEIIGVPLLAGLLVVATHVPLGREVLRRGIISLIWQWRRSPVWV